MTSPSDSSQTKITPKLSSLDNLKPSKSGIITTSNGYSYVPASMRLDGSIRPELRVRPGYKPPEDIEVYRIKGLRSTFTNSCSAHVVGSQFVDSGKFPQPGPSVNVSSTTSRDVNFPTPVKSRRKRSAKPNSVNKTLPSASPLHTHDGSLSCGNENSDSTSTNPISLDQDNEVENARKVKRLSKKLRQVRALQSSSAKLHPDQVRKIACLDDLVRQLRDLGVNDEAQAIQTDVIPLDYAKNIESNSANSQKHNKDFRSDDTLHDK